MSRNCKLIREIQRLQPVLIQSAILLRSKLFFLSQAVSAHELSSVITSLVKTQDGYLCSSWIDSTLEQGANVSLQLTVRHCIYWHQQIIIRSQKQYIAYSQLNLTHWEEKKNPLVKLAALFGSKIKKSTNPRNFQRVEAKHSSLRLLQLQLEDSQINRYD